MNKTPEMTELPRPDRALEQWQQEFARSPGVDKAVCNRSDIEIKPLYTPADWRGDYSASLGYPGQPPYTRGIYASMHRGRTWTQRQLIGLGTPEDFNARVRDMISRGANAFSLIPCNSVFRGYDMDEVHAELLGTCGVVANTAEHIDQCLAGVDLARTSSALSDPSPFTMFAFLLATAKRRGVNWRSITGTSNQSDYLSHYVACHMLTRLSLSGTRRLLMDHIDFCTRQVPNWNPMSVVGQHMQQAGATPAEAMAFTLCSAIQYAEDCMGRGMDPDDFLPRFTFFFDISISFFEEIAKLRAGRRIWARIARDRLGARDPRSWRFKFHGQTSGIDLTRQQPLNNIARVTVQAIAGIFGGLQSLHTDSYDEVLACPTEFGSRIAVNTQNILREEAHLTDVIDPLGGSYYIEALTDEMEQKIGDIMSQVEEAGGMYQAVEQGLPQKMIGASARRFQEKIESGEERVVGVNAYQLDDDRTERQVLPPPDPVKMQAHIARFKAFREQRSQAAVQAARDRLASAAADARENLFARIVEAAEVGCTHGEICTILRAELGFGRPPAIV